MRFDHFMEQHRRVMATLEEVGRKGGITLKRKDGKFSFGCHPQNLSTVARNHVMRIDNNSDLLENYIFSQITSKGPKVFRPKRYDFEVLEQMNLSLNFEDYNQPFPTMVIELPDHYLAKKRVECPQGGEQAPDASYITYPDEHVPVFVIVHWEPEMNVMFLQVTFTSLQSIKVSLVPHENQEIEPYLMNVTDGEIFDHSMDVSDDEWDVVRSVCKSALNYCLLVDEIGTKKIGPSNPGYYERLLKQSQKRPDEQNRLSRKLHPMIFDLDHETELIERKVIPQSDHEPVPTGRVRESQWVRGHYKMQPYGPKNSLRKRIRIKPYLIHPEQWLGGQQRYKA